jgi:hypothetical protein
MRLVTNWPEILLTPPLLILVAVPLLLVFFEIGYRYILTYRLTDTSVLIVLFGLLPVFRVRYDSIEEVKMIPFSEFWKAAFKYQHVLKFGNRILGGGVLIRRKRKFPVMISPDDAEEFVREVRRRTYQGTGEWPLVS